MGSQHSLKKPGASNAKSNAKKADSSIWLDYDFGATDLYLSPIERF